MDFEQELCSFDKEWDATQQMEFLSQCPDIDGVVMSLCTKYNMTQSHMILLLLQQCIIHPQSPVSTINKIEISKTIKKPDYLLFWLSNYEFNNHVSTVCFTMVLHVLEMIINAYYPQSSDDLLTHKEETETDDETTRPVLSSHSLESLSTLSQPFTSVIEIPSENTVHFNNDDKDDKDDKDDHVDNLSMAPPIYVIQRMINRTILWASTEKESTMILKFLKTSCEHTPHYLSSLLIFFDTVTFMEIKIIAARLLCNLGHSLKVYIIPIMVQWCTDNDLPRRIRADAADMIIQMGRPNDGTTLFDVAIDIATQSLTILGIEDDQRLGEKPLLYSIYQDKENVHTSKIMTTCIKTIELLYPYLPASREEQNIKFNRYKSAILQKHSHIRSALDRIELDGSTYSDHQMSLKQIFVCLHIFIDTHPDYHTTCYQRLIEELCDMQNTCATGYATRLVNVLTGIVPGMGLEISMDDQFTAVFLKQLQNMIMKDNNADLILEEMVAPILADRQNFLTFIGKNMSTLRENLYREFKEWCSDVLFDTTFKLVVAKICNF